MQANSPRAYIVSTILHVVVVVILLVIGFLVQQRVEKAPKIFELVAGEGDDYNAKTAPALGTPDAIKFNAQEAPVVKPAPPEPVQAAPEPVIERAPVTPAPKVTPVKPPPNDAIRDFSKDVKRISTKRQKNMEAKDRKLREIAEKKEKAAEERKKATMTKAEFDRLNKSKSAAPKSAAAPKIAKIDTKGIASGMTGGDSSAKKGAGGKALTREDGDALDLYFSLLKRRLKEALDKPPGLSDSLVAIVEVRIAANGLLSGAKIARSSGSEDFDHAALAAVARVRSIGPRPDGKSEVLTIPFLMKEEDEG